MRALPALLLLALVPLWALAPTASATGFMCSPSTTSQSGTVSTQCLLFVYEGDFLVCAGGRHDEVPNPPWTHPRDEYECLAEV